MKQITTEDVNQIFKEIYNNIINSDRSFDIEFISKLITNKLIAIYDAETCELKTINKDEDRINTLSFSLKEKDDTITADLITIEKRFGKKTTQSQGSLISSILDEKQNDNIHIFSWWGDEKDNHNESFRRFVQIKSNEKKINKKSTEQYLRNIPSGKISNFIILTISLPIEISEEENNKASFKKYKINFCLHLHNVNNHTTNLSEINEITLSLKEILNLLSIPIYNAIYFKYVNQEVEIANKIKEINLSADSFEYVLEQIAIHFGEKLNSALNTIWYYDKENNLLGLHSYLYNSKNSGNKFFTIKDIEEIIKNFNIPKLLKRNTSIMGKLINKSDPYWKEENNINKFWIKESDINMLDDYKWKEVNDNIKTKQFIAIPIRSQINNDEDIIAIIGFHPNLTENDFDKMSFIYFRNFIEQILPTIHYFIEKKFSNNAKELAEGIRKIILSNQEIAFKELVKIIKKILNAEACSIFEARFQFEDNKGVFLIETTDESTKARKMIGKKIYEIDNNSITGYVAQSKKPIIINDVMNVVKYYSAILNNSTVFIENTLEQKHNSYIAVPTILGNDNNDSFYIIRCINKINKSNNMISDLFNEQDKNLLLYAGTIVESYRNILKVISERNHMLEMINHEIENPIASIRNKTISISNLINSNKYRLTEVLGNEKLDKLIEKIDDINSLINFFKYINYHTFELSRLLSGKKIDILCTEFNLLKTIKNVIYWMRPHLSDYDLNSSDILFKKFNPNVCVNIDINHFIQVIYNLINNALKYKDGSMKTEIEIEYCETKDNLELKFKDWGIGIDEVTSNNIFKLGYKSKYSIENKIKGNGFGLYLSKKLLNANGLNIYLSNYSKPTTFTIIIPIKYVSISNLN